MMKLYKSLLLSTILCLPLTVFASAENNDAEPIAVKREIPSLTSKCLDFLTPVLLLSEEDKDNSPEDQKTMQQAKEDYLKALNEINAHNCQRALQLIKMEAARKGQEELEEISADIPTVVFKLIYRVTQPDGSVVTHGEYVDNEVYKNLPKKDQFKKEAIQEAFGRILYHGLNHDYFNLVTALINMAVFDLNKEDEREFSSDGTPIYTTILSDKPFEQKEKWIRLFVSKGANINGKAYGSTYLQRTILHAEYPHEIISPILLPMVRLLLSLGANVNTTAAGYTTPLISAIRGGHKEVVHTLLEAGADPLIAVSETRDEFNAIDVAKDIGSEQIIEMVTKAATKYTSFKNMSDERRHQELRKAMRLDDPAKLLSKYEAGLTTDAECYDIVTTYIGSAVPSPKDAEERNSFAQDLLYVASQQGCYKFAKAVLKLPFVKNACVSSRNRSALYNAVERKDIEMARLFLSKGATVNYCEEYSPFMNIFTETTYDNSMVELFLQHGADINAVDKCRDYGESVPIHAALRFEMPIEDKVKAVQFLIDQGADVNKAIAGGYTSLHHFLYLINSRGYNVQEYLPLVQLLLNQGATVDTARETGKHLLETAADVDNAELVEVLLDNITDVETKDVLRQRVVEYARDNDKQNILAAFGQQ